MLEVKDLEAKIAATGQPILKGVNLTIRNGEVHAIMGKNGSGKSTLSKVLVGHPDYEVTNGSAVFKGKNLFEMEPEERSHLGLFLSFQTPIEVPGVSNVDFLRMACNARRKALGQSELDPLEFYAYIMPKVRRAHARNCCEPCRRKHPYRYPIPADTPHRTDGPAPISSPRATFYPNPSSSSLTTCPISTVFMPAAGDAEHGPHLPQPQRQRGLLGWREEAQ